MEKTEDRKEFLKNFIWNSLGTGINAFNSLFFLIIVTHINGTTSAGIFSLGYATASILYTVAMYSGRLCQVTDIKGKIKDNDYILTRIITCFFMAICVTIFLIAKKYSLYKTSVFILLATFRGIEAFADVLYGVMQKNGYLYKCGFSLFIKGIIGVISFLIVDLVTNNLDFACLSIIVVNFVILFLYDYLKITKKLIEKDKPKRDHIISIIKNEFFVFANSFAGIYILNAPKYAIDGFLSEDMQAIYGYIMMPATVMTLFTQFIVMPFLSKMKEMYENKKIDDIIKTSFKIKMVVIAFGGFAVLCAFLLGPEVLRILYGVDELLNYRMNLCVIIGSYIFYALSYVDLVELTTVRHTFSQFVIYMISIVVAFVGSSVLVRVLGLGINGATFSCTTTLGLQYIMYFVVTKITMNKVKKEIIE